MGASRAVKAQAFDQKASSLYSLNEMPLSDVFKNTGDPSLDAFLNEPTTNFDDRSPTPGDYANGPELVSGGPQELGKRRAIAAALRERAWEFRFDEFKYYKRINHFSRWTAEYPMKFEAVDALYLLNLPRDHLDNWHDRSDGTSIFLTFRTLLDRSTAREHPDFNDVIRSLISRIDADRLNIFTPAGKALLEECCDLTGDDFNSTEFGALLARCEAFVNPLREVCIERASPFFHQSLRERASFTNASEKQNDYESRIAAFLNLSKQARAAFFLDVVRCDTMKRTVDRHSREIGVKTEFLCPVHDLPPIYTKFAGKLESDIQRRKMVFSPAQALAVLECARSYPWRSYLHLRTLKSLLTVLDASDPNVVATLKAYLDAQDRTDEQELKRKSLVTKFLSLAPEVVASVLPPNDYLAMALDAYQDRLRSNLRGGAAPLLSAIWTAEPSGADTADAFAALEQGRQALTEFLESGPSITEFYAARLVTEALQAQCVLARSKCLAQLNEGEMDLLQQMDRVVDRAPNTSKPSKRYLNSVDDLVVSAGIKPLSILFEKTSEFHPVASFGQMESDFAIMARMNTVGLVWAAARFDPQKAANPLLAIALRSYQSKPGFGMVDERVGNACLWSLQHFSDGAGTPYLARIAARVKYPKVKKKIDAALNAAAEAAGMTRTDLDELLVPDNGFTDGQRRFDTEQGSAVLTLTPNGKLDLAWLNANGKPVKTPAAAMKATHNDTIKEAKALAKEALADLSVQLQRIERLPLENRAIPAVIFTERYLDQPLIGTACHALIWQVGDRAGLWQDGALRDLSGEAIPLEGNVRLWHPVEHSPETVIAWRDRLEEIDLVQPIKQAWREVYLITDAERATGTYSNRFAGHILKQHQTMTLARMNGWQCKHRMAVDAPNDDPTWIAFPAFGVHAEFWNGQQDVDSPTLDSGAFVYVHTDRTAFFRRTETGRGQPMAAEDVPPIVFSEVMRHCDLFVSVASISTDPKWVDRGADAGHPSGWDREADVYWHDSSAWDLAGSAIIRRAALDRIVPRLKIAKQLTLTEKHLRVQGVKGAYRIHLASAAVHREADDRHVCIVPKGRDLSRTAAIKLPFEGDRTLSLILSKAMLLTADDKITDKVILDQI